MLFNIKNIFNFFFSLYVMCVAVRCFGFRACCRLSITVTST